MIQNALVINSLFLSYTSEWKIENYECAEIGVKSHDDEVGISYKGGTIEMTNFEVTGVREIPSV